MTDLTQILPKVNWDRLNEYIDGNLIITNKHPEYDLWILNYTPKTQAQGIWDEYTLSCRGLVIDNEGNIIARPFKKFKNYEEYSPSEIPTGQEYEVFEKMDGSLIILFYYKESNEWIVASRGSFISEQALEAKKMLNVNNFKFLNKNSTYLFEVIYPENRIVVDYGNTRDLVLLGVVDTKHGFEMYYDDVKQNYSKYFTIVEKHKIKNINNFFELKALEEDNREGFVIRFLNGFRMKIKFTEYLRLHAIVTNVSNLTIWEHLKNGYDFDELIDRVPDEFYNWVIKTKDDLKRQFMEIELGAYKTFVNITHVNEITDRKEFAINAKKTEYRAILFKLYDKRNYDEIIWKQIRPVYSKPFKDGH